MAAANKIAFPQVERQWALALHAVIDPSVIDQAGTSITVGTLPPGAQVLAVIGDVITAFDGTSVALAVKDSGGATMFTAAPGAAARTVTDPATLKSYINSDKLTLEYDAGFAPTVGLAYITIVYTIAGRSNEVTI